MNKARALMSVTNDLVTDQRVDKVARSLLRMGYSVELTGRKKKDSPELPQRAYKTHRFVLLFEKGPAFYAEYNLRLFFFLLRKKANVLIANDLDTLLPNYLVSRLKGIPLVYDSHEYFTGVPELEDRPWVKRIWKSIERAIFPRLHDIFTVNDSIAGLYQEEYHKQIRVLRNVPEYGNLPPKLSRQQLGLPADRPILLLQGAGINVQRGAEEAVEAMQYLDDALLLIIGGGDVLETLKNMVAEKKLEQKVWFYPKQPFQLLYQYTVCADIGLTLDKDTSLNYRFSLPNKLFDYIRAEVPVLASPLPEVRKIIEEYQIGVLIDHHDPKHIAQKIQSMIVDKKQQAKWKENLKLAASKLRWESEEFILQDVYRKFI